MKRQCLLMVGALALLAAGAGGQTVYYVDADVNPPGDGSAWCKAFDRLQVALILASITGGEIRVAEGTYKPELPPGRAATFQLLNNVPIYGGYAGCGEPDPDARDVTLYITTLSGDLNGDDLPGFVNNGDNSFHVVTGSGTDATAILDGFTIKGGNADRRSPDPHGGGMYNVSGSPTINACTFELNRADSDAGGMYNNDSSPTITASTFLQNEGFFGGGMLNTNGSNPMLTGCLFKENVASSVGGGIDNTASAPVLVDCEFREKEVKGDILL